MNPCSRAVVRISLFACSVLLTGISLSAGTRLTEAGGLSVSIADRSITAQGLTPGAGAVFFGVAHEPHIAYYSVRRTAQYVADDDRDGVVTYTAAAAIPLKSVWIVADPRTGRHAVAAPGDWGDRLTAQGHSRVARNANGDRSSLAHARPWLELLVIRPGGDIWALTAMRGGAADREKAGGPDFSTPVDLFRPVTPGTKPLERLTTGDVVIAIDADEVEYFAVSVE